MISLNLRSKLIAAMLLGGALTGVSQAYWGNYNISKSVQERLDVSLEALAAMTNASVELYFRSSRGTIAALGSDLMVADALDAFASGMRSIDPKFLTPDMETGLTEYYANEFVPGLAKVSDGKPVLQSFIPEQAQARYLQFLYIADNKAGAGKRDQLDYAADGSAYSAAHKRYHAALRGIRDGFQFADIFLISPNGDVVYSAAKEPDFLTNLIFGPFSDSGLAKAFKGARENRNTRPVVIEDFSFYQPSQGAPATFIATPVFDSNNAFVGVVAAQLSSDLLNSIVTKGADWTSIGLAETGDIYVVGNDGLYRTTSRVFEEDRERFFDLSAKKGTDQVLIDRMKAFETPILLQRTLSADDAKRDKSLRTIVRENALGTLVRSHTLPLKIGGLDWITVAEMSVEEANQPAAAFQRVMMLVLAITITITTIVAMILSGLLAQPLKLLTERFAKIAAGDSGTTVALPQRDEIGELSRSAQAAVDMYRLRLSDVEKGRQGIESLLNRFLPDGVVRLILLRSKVAGQAESALDSVSETIPDATFVVGQLSGYEDILARFPAQDVVSRLNELVQIIDVAADNHGVEKVRMAGDTYFGVAGLSTPHLDHHQRGLAFARELRAIIETFGRDYGLKTSARIGIASGSAISGTIGRNKLAFDVWGQAVSAAEVLSSAAAPGEIRVTPDFAAAIKDAESFTQPASAAGHGLVFVEQSAQLGAGMSGQVKTRA